MIAPLPPVRFLSAAHHDRRIHGSAGLYLTWNRPEALR